MKRYNLLDGEAYGKRYQMVEETNGDWVWWEDVEAMTTLSKLETLSKDIFCAAFGRWQPPDEKAAAELVRWSVHIARGFLTYLDKAQQGEHP